MSGFAIFKYPISNERVQLPRGATVLSLQMQDGAPVIWATVDPDAPLVSRRYWVLPTGNLNPVLEQILEKAEFLGTFQLDLGLVFHVWIEAEADGT